MTHLYIDPFSLVCPQTNEGNERFHIFLENIIKIRELLGSPGIECYIPSDTSEVLLSTNSYPLWPDLEKCIQTFGISHIQTKDVDTIVTSILNQIHSIEKRCGIEEMLIEDISINPSNHLNERCRDFKNIYEKLFGLASILKNINATSDDPQLLLTRGLLEETVNVTISGNISALDSNENFPISTLPILINNTIPHHNTLDLITRSLVSLELWISSRDNSGYENALKVKLEELESTSPKNTVHSWVFHKDFLNSADQNNFLHDPLKAKKLLRVLSETILDINNKDTHWLRISAGGNAPQRKRGADAAWRRDIDNEYRLHYWVTSKKEIEFASVGVHENFSIPN